MSQALARPDTITLLTKPADITAALDALWNFSPEGTRNRPQPAGMLAVYVLHNMCRDRPAIMPQDRGALNLLQDRGLVDLEGKVSPAVKRTVLTSFRIVDGLYLQPVARVHKDVVASQAATVPATNATIPAKVFQLHRPSTWFGGEVSPTAQPAGQLAAA